jgi:hypothetical protein
MSPGADALIQANPVSQSIKSESNIQQLLVRDPRTTAVGFPREGDGRVVTHMNLVSTPRRVSRDHFSLLVDLRHNHWFFITGFPMNKPQQKTIPAFVLGSEGKVAVHRSLATPWIRVSPVQQLGALQYGHNGNHGLVVASLPRM